MLQTHIADVAAPGEGESGASEQMVLFVVGGHRFGIAIERIREIIPARPYTPLPGSGEHVRGREGGGEETFEARRAGGLTVGVVRADQHDWRAA